jgi:hypothetical protein
VFKMFVAFIGVAALALGGAVVLLVWISSMTPIHVTEEFEPTGPPPTAQDWVDQGAVLLAVGEVEAVYGAEWSTADRSRPGTPWAVSGVPEDHWIQTPILVDLVDEPVLLRPRVMDALGSAEPEVDLILALRGGEIGDDRHEVIDGQNRDFEPGDQVALVLSVKNQELAEPELIDSSFGAGWEFLGRYRIENDTAILQWGDDVDEQPLEELINAFEQAAE